MAEELGVIGKYRLVEEVGRGGMGVVFRADQVDLGRAVAVKMILSNHLASETAVRRFYAEATAAAQVRHPNVVDVYEVGELNGQHFIAMEFVEGESLDAVAERGPMDPKEAARCMQQVADAVDHLHRQGIVHRDLKPSNVLMDQENRPRVTDFGLARMADVKGLTLDSASVIGTPGYMAPELVLGTSQGDARSDVYSLGAILHELLTGQPLFEKESAVQMLLKVMGANPRPARAVNPDVPPELEQICLKCLRKEPGKRYGSAAELAEDLVRFGRSEPVEARAPGLWQAMGQWMRRKPGLAARLVGLAIFFLVHLVIRYSDTDPTLSPEFTVQLGGIFLFWGCTSVVLQSLLDRGYRPRLVHHMWIGTDILCLTGLLLTIGSGPQSPIIPTYLVLIVVSGIWFDARLVWFTTGLAALGYLVLVLNAHVYRPEFMVRAEATHLLFLTVAFFTGFFAAQQARRVGALTRFCSRGPGG